MVSLTHQASHQRLGYIHTIYSWYTIGLTLKMTQVFETSVSVANYSPLEKCTQPDDQLLTDFQYSAKFVDNYDYPSVLLLSYLKINHAWTTNVFCSGSRFDNCTHPDEHARQASNTPSFKPFTTLSICCSTVLLEDESPGPSSSHSQSHLPGPYRVWQECPGWATGQ